MHFYLDAGINTTRNSMLSTTKKVDIVGPIAQLEHLVNNEQPR